MKPEPSIEFVSEPVTPDPGTFDTGAMAAGQAGLPTGFTWRGRHYAVRQLLEDWKQSESSGRTGGQRYYRKHYFRVRTADGATLTLYAVRQVKPGESGRRRWWLYTIERPA